MVVNKESQLAFWCPQVKMQDMIYRSMTKNMSYYFDELKEDQRPIPKTYGGEIRNDLTKEIAIAEYKEYLEKSFGLNHGQHSFYLPTKTAIETSKKIKLSPDKFDARFLGKIKDRKKITFLMGENKFYRMHKEDGIIIIYALTYDKPADYLSYITFVINTINGEVYRGIEQAHPLSNPDMLEFFQLLIFVELSELETVVLAPNQSNGTRKTGKVKNNVQNTIEIIVDSNWNKTIIASGFSVSAHLRLQPCGIGKLERKLILINGFEKSGYVRAAGKLKETNN